MALRIRWTGQAIKRFDSIVALLENEWGSRVTEQFIKKNF